MKELSKEIDQTCSNNETFPTKETDEPFNDSFQEVDEMSVLDESLEDPQEKDQTYNKVLY